jgi:predicted RNase H-like HicB family nuclease
MNKGPARKRGKGKSAKPFKIIVEKHPDGYVAYPLGLKGVVVGEGDTCEQTMADVKSAIHFHIETFGMHVLAENQLAGFIAKYSPEIGTVAYEVLAKMRELTPGAVEMVYDNYNALVIGFGPTERAS